MLAVIGLLSASALAVASSVAGSRVIRYHGYRLVVPSAWPVYNLVADPTTCVRFNRHAVYLGQPGVEQRCPAHAVGRTEAIWVQPLAATAAGARARGRGAGWRPKSAGARNRREDPSPNSTSRRAG